MISLKIEVQENYVDIRTQSFVIKATILSNTRGPTELFMVLVSKGSQFFSHIASPVDTLEYGTDPDTVTDSYYRTNVVMLSFRCKSDASEAVRLLKIDLDEHDRSTKVGEVLIDSETVTIGE